MTYRIPERTYDVRRKRFVDYIMKRFPFIDEISFDIDFRNHVMNIYHHDVGLGIRSKKWFILEVDRISKYFNMDLDGMLVEDPDIDPDSFSGYYRIDQVKSYYY